jgi:hypothetical protein
MTELSRSLLTAARDGLSPDAAVAARVRAKVAAAVAAPAAATAVVGDAAAAPAKASLPIAKLGIALLVVAIASTTIVLVGSERTPAAPRVEMQAQEAADAPANERSAVAEDPLVLPDAPRVRAKQAVAAPSAPTTREPATLSREVELIDLAMVSLRKQAPLAAIEAIRVFERETLGRGQMAEDAAAIEIEARCVLGEDVSSALARFDRTWPESAQRERIQRTCFATGRR